MAEIAGPPLELDPVGQAVSAARRYVAGCLVQLRATELTDSAELGVSELVTNAILHTGQPLAVTVKRTDDGVIRVEVTDRSPLLPHQRRVSVLATTGRGLRLVASVSSDWGVLPLAERDGPGKIVWFEPVEDGTASGFEDAEWAADLEALLR